MPLLVIVVLLCAPLVWAVNERLKMRTLLNFIGPQDQTRMCCAAEYHNSHSQPRWKRLLIGDDSPGDIRALHVFNVSAQEPISGHLWGMIYSLPRLEEFSITNGELTGDHMRALSHLTQLKILALSVDFAKEATLQSLAHFKQLERLSLHGKDIAEEDLQIIGQLTDLQTLLLAGPQITDAGVSHLAGLTQLQILNLRNTQVTDDGMATIARLTDLRQLSLGSLELTDQGFVALDSLTNLEQLFLDCPRLTGDCVPALAKLPNLRLVSFGNNPQSAEMVRLLEQLCPNVEAQARE